MHLLAQEQTHSCRHSIQRANVPAGCLRACRQQRPPNRHRSRCNAAVLPEGLQAIVQQAGTAHPGWASGAAVNAAVFVAGSPVLLKGLTGWGMVNAFILGTTVYAAFGAGGFALVCLYFLFGTAVSNGRSCITVTLHLQPTQAGGQFCLVCP